jgi:hypothetical protein
MSSPGRSESTDDEGPAGSTPREAVSDDASEARLGSLRSQIEDLAHEVNTRKAKLGAALGGSVFLLLLSAGAAYDLARDNLVPWSMIGLDRQLLTWIAAASGLTSITLLVLGLVKLLPESHQREDRLAELEREYGDLLE